MPHLCLTAGDIIASYDKIIVDPSFLNSDLNDPKMHKKAQDLTEAGNGTNALDFDINQIWLRLQHLESDLASALHLLTSRADAGTAGKVYNLFLSLFGYMLQIYGY